MGDRIQRLNKVAQDGDIDAKIQRLSGIAQQGDIDAFYNIIQEDVKLLEYIDTFPFVDTPLHISASAGHSPFSLEMMILKPSFVSKRNPNGHTPIYLALLNGHTEMVHHILQHNADLVHVKGRECMTPLHYTATTNDLLENFLSVCPDSITDVTTQNETVLHITFKYNNLEVFKFLVGWLLRKWPYWRKILEQKDVEGNTIFHIAVSRNQTQAVRDLFAWGGRFECINYKNLEGKTALDILEGQQTQGVDISEMRVILERAGALTASSLPPVTSSYAHYLTLPVTCERAIIFFFFNRVMKPITDEKRNALLVVAALLVTVTYQAILSPPGGLWQDDLFKPNTTTAALSPPSLAWGLFDESNSNITAPHRAGSAIAGTTVLFNNFFGYNTVIFFLSNVIMVVLVPPVIGFLLGVVCVILCLCYYNSLLIITQPPALWAALYYAVLLFAIVALLMALLLKYTYLISPSALIRIRAMLNLI